jgi:hypothetical protein
VAKPDPVIVRTYKTAKDFEKDAKKLAKKGYVPSLQSHAAVPKGFAGRVASIGTLGVFGSANKSEITVTYTRPADTK